MTRVDFHVNIDDRVLHACRLVRKIHRSGLRVVVCSSDPARLAAFDQALWTFSPHDFVPHVMASDRLAAETPVLLTADAEAAPWYPVLVNLGDDTPAGFARFERLIELVGAGEAERAAARSRWRFYRDRGYALTLHDMATADAER
jgi:DNA polymerase-3 subunit chi